MVARLARRLGSARLDLAEEAVQDALVRALSIWPFSGVPAEPRGWLFQVARNRAIDLLRRESSLRGKLGELESVATEALREQGTALGDDELAMMFMCCHPALSPPARGALTLKTVGGGSVPRRAGSHCPAPGPCQATDPRPGHRHRDSARGRARRPARKRARRALPPLQRGLRRSRRRKPDPGGSLRRIDPAGGDSWREFRHRSTRGARAPRAHAAPGEPPAGARGRER